MWPCKSLLGMLSTLSFINHTWMQDSSGRNMILKRRVLMFTACFFLRRGTWQQSCFIDNQLYPLVNHLWRLTHDSLIVLVPFPHSYPTLAMATLHLHKPWRPPGLVKLSFLWAWDGSLPTSKHQTHENRYISTGALVQRGSKNTNHFWFYSVVAVELQDVLKDKNTLRYRAPEAWDCLNAYFVKVEPSISEADGNCGG